MVRIMSKKIKTKRPKIGVAFSGGSALGICHLGAVKALSEHRVIIDCVSGTSAGSIVAGGVAFGVPLKKMVEICKQLSWSNLSEFGYSKMGINYNRPVGEIIRDMVGNANIEDAYIPLAIVATDIDTGEKVVFRKGSVAEAVMASTCLPGFFVPVKIKDRKLVDGGLMENLPLSPLKSMGAEVRVGVDLGHFRTYKKTHNIVDVITNSYGILTRVQERFVPQEAEVLIEPHLEKYTSSDFNKANELMKIGYQATKKKIPEIKAQMVICPIIVEGFLERIRKFFKKKIF